jgi:hypothetical protein
MPRRVSARPSCRVEGGMVRPAGLRPLSPDRFGSTLSSQEREWGPIVTMVRGPESYELVRAQSGDAAVRILSSPVLHRGGRRGASPYVGDRKGDDQGRRRSHSCGATVVQARRPLGAYDISRPQTFEPLRGCLLLDSRLRHAWTRPRATTAPQVKVRLSRSRIGPPSPVVGAGPAVRNGS